MAEEKTKQKDRFFTFLLYPDSLPEDWVTKLEMVGLPMAVSPLHDKDRSDREGEDFKKPHYHVFYVAKNPVTTDAVRRRIQRALGDKALSHVQIIKRSAEGMYLYLTHESKDAIQKNKHVYPKEDLIHLNNFDIDRYISDSVEEKEALFNLVCDIIDEEELANIRELRRYIARRGEQHGIRSMAQVNAVLRQHTGLVRLYFDGVYQERRYGQHVKVDEETGEILS